MARTMSKIRCRSLEDVSTEIISTEYKWNVMARGAIL